MNVAVGIERGKDVPVVSLGELANLEVLAGEELVEEISNRRGRDPFASVDSTLDEDTGFLLAEAQFHALDHTALGRLTGVHHLDL